MRILLIGATGQIGHALSGALSRAEHRVRVLVRSTQGLPFPADLEIERHPEFTPAVFRRVLIDVDAVIYGVGLPEQFFFDRNTHERVNRGLLETFLGELAGSRVRRLIYISTYEVFESRGGVIRESHPVVEDTRHMSVYFRTMVEAYRLVTSVAESHGVELTTIHPAAVYGGRNTGRGVTTYLEDLLHRRFWRVPFIFPTHFPVVEANSLAEAIVRSLGATGPFLVSDQMTRLQEIALELRRQTGSYVPPVAPTRVAQLGAATLEMVARVIRVPPIMAPVQVEFLTLGDEPVATKASTELGWSPLPLSEGLRRYLEKRTACGQEAHARAVG
jgi:dihydroflavonol-4-reductase